MQVAEDCELSQRIIRSPDFKNYSMADRYRELEQRAKVDLSPAIRLLDILPVFMNGSSHQTVRRRMAKQISSTMPQQLAFGRKEVEDRLDRLLFQGSRFDLVEDFARPVWRAVSGSIVPRHDATVDLVDRIPELFRPLLSIRERLKISDSIGRYLESHCDGDDEKLILLGLAALGARPFVGSTGLSLYDVFERHPAIKMCDIPWPKSFPSSSLRYVDRIAQADVVVCEQRFEPDARVRCVTQSPNYQAVDNHRLLFGVGPHTCIGKLTAEKMWAMIVEQLSKYEFRVECTGMVLAEHNDPFTMPARATVSLA